MIVAVFWVLYDIKVGTRFFVWIVLWLCLVLGLGFGFGLRYVLAL